jgi:hypothetical protein
MLFGITASILRILFSTRATTSANSLETHSPHEPLHNQCATFTITSQMSTPNSAQQFTWWISDLVHQRTHCLKPPLPTVSSYHPLFLQLLSLPLSFAKPYCLVVWVSQIVTIWLFLTNYLHPSPLTGKYSWLSTCKT